jgi:hypothetical protein
MEAVYRESRDDGFDLHTHLPYSFIRSAPPIKYVRKIGAISRVEWFRRARMSAGATQREASAAASVGRNSAGGPPSRCPIKIAQTTKPRITRMLVRLCLISIGMAMMMTRNINSN